MRSLAPITRRIPPSVACFEGMRAGRANPYHNVLVTRVEDPTGLLEVIERHVKGAYGQVPEAANGPVARPVRCRICLGRCPRSIQAMLVSRLMIRASGRMARQLYFIT